jgi:TonB-linked SusC/RagA family outer membrane protein
MNLISIRKKRRPAIALLLCTGLLGACPPDAVADAGDRLPVPEIQQSKSPVKRTLVGTVTDASTGETLIGVNVIIKGTTQGTVTDLDGKFSIEVTGKDEIEISYIGYKTQTIEVGDLGVLNVKMEGDNEVLDEVVVVGAGTQKKVSITGAITATEGIQLKAPTSSLTSSLAGKLAGVISTNSSGEPGSTSAFYIRGINTFGGVATPLILLDGVEISSGDLNRIPAESIESFSVLKDASATAIYGNRGANGVMLVTTKHGKENTKATVNVSVEASYFQPMNTPEFADGPTFMRTYNEAQQARSATVITPRYSDEIIAATESGINPYVYPNVDWYDMIFRSGNYNQRANVNVSGGASRVTYYMSLQANHDTGLLNAADNSAFNPNINHWEYNFQNNISYKLTNTTTVNLRMMAQIGSQKGPNNKTTDIYKKVMYANPVSFPAYFPGEEDHIYYGNAEIKAGAYGENPYQYMMGSFREDNFNTLNTSLDISQDLGFVTKGLSAKVLVNFKNWSNSYYTRSLSPYYYQVQPDSYDPENDTYALRLLQTGTDYISQSDITKEADQTFYLDARLDWKRSFGKHNMTAMFMYMMREYRNGVLPNRNQGYSGRATYDYDNRYLVEFNFGYNGSENFAPGKRYGFFPAGSIGWVVSEEEFMKKASWIDFLKVRASYGLVGSDNVSSRFPYLAFYGGGSGYDFGNNFGTNVGGTSEGNLANANLTWEKARKLNVGIDFTTLNQRLALTIDAFYEYRFDIITDMNSDGIMGYPDIVGKDAALQNLGEVSNRGVDIELSWNDKIGKDFRYYIRPNLTFSRNRLEYKAEVARKNSWRKETGKRLYENFVYVFDHFVADQEEADRLNKIGYQPWGQLIPGDVVYKDLDRNGVIDDEDRTAMGNPRSPELMFGIPFGFQYKNFDFSVLLQGATKSSILLNGAAVFDFPQFEQDKIGRVKKMHLDRWTPETAATAKYPALHYGTHDNNKNGNSSLFLYDASYLRLKNVEIGYNVSPKLLRKFHVQQARIYVQGLNLLTFDKLGDVDIDPETKSGDGASWYPIQKVFNFGIDITF